MLIIIVITFITFSGWNFNLWDRHEFLKLKKHYHYRNLKNLRTHRHRRNRTSPERNPMDKNFLHSIPTSWTGSSPCPIRSNRQAMTVPDFRCTSRTGPCSTTWSATAVSRRCTPARRRSCSGRPRRRSRVWKGFKSSYVLNQGGGGRGPLRVREEGLKQSCTTYGPQKL